MIQAEYLGPSSILNLQDIIKKHQVKRVFLVTGKKSFFATGAKSLLLPFLDDVDIITFSNFNINPQLEDVKRGIKLFHEATPDLVIAIGGGSVMDMGKLINILAVQTPNNLSSIIKNSALIKKQGAPLVAIPTTAGTGSEATHFAVVYIDKVKYSLAHQYIIPNYAIVDPILCYKTPPKIFAVCAMDALSQAVESYWAVGSNELSKTYASRAIKLILPNIQQAVLNQSKDAIEKMTLAAHLAGQAINISKTTAAHAISYPITTYFGVPHGHAVALTLGKFFILNAALEKVGLNERRGKAYLRQTMMELYEMFGCSSAERCSELWYELLVEIGLEVDWTNIGVREKSDFHLIAQNVNLERLNNNPVQVSEQMLYELLA